VRAAISFLLVFVLASWLRSSTHDDVKLEGLGSLALLLGSVFERCKRDGNLQNIVHVTATLKGLQML
jgi:hypothetical protein